MKRLFSSVINVKDKKLNWLNCNYCYVTTIIMICVMLICNFCLAQPIHNLLNQDIRWNVILCSFWYNGGNYHLLGNIMGLITDSIFLERHFGSLKYAGLLILSIPLANLACFAFSNSWNWGGFSCVEYFWHANIIFLLAFNFKTYFMGKMRWIFPVILLAFMVIMMSWTWSGTGTSGVGISLFAGFNNTGHYAPFLCGTIVALFVNLFSLKKKNAFKEKSQSQI